MSIITQITFLCVKRVIFCIFTRVSSVSFCVSVGYGSLNSIADNVAGFKLDLALQNHHLPPDETQPIGLGGLPKGFSLVDKELLQYQYGHPYISA